jgi:prepilin peptidase CpaA
MLLAQPTTGVLCALLVLAAVIDCRSYRIPNWLTVSGAAFGLICNALTSASANSGLLTSAGGLVFGFAIMLQLYLLRIAGAGDVKLMAMVGAFLGFWSTLPAVAFIFVTGGIAALAFALWRGVLGRLIGNAKTAAQNIAFAAIGGVRYAPSIDPGKSVGRLPYGVSIAAGTIAYLVCKQLGYA